MKTLQMTSAALAAAALLIPLLPKPAVATGLTAWPGAARPALASDDASLIKVGHRHRRYHRHHRGEDVEVDAPTTYVRTRRGHVVVEAPFTSVRRSHRGVHVRAPFVDIWVPRHRY